MDSPDAETLAALVWAGDVDALQDLAPCRCCCDEHTFGRGCPAYAWGGCRGQYSMTRSDLESWERHYASAHGMTWERFHGYETTTKERHEDR